MDTRTGKTDPSVTVSDLPPTAPSPFSLPDQPPPIHDHFASDYQRFPTHQDVPLLGVPTDRELRYHQLGGESSRGGDYWDWRYNNPGRAEWYRKTFALRLGIAVVFMIVAIVVTVVVVNNRRNSQNN